MEREYGTTIVAIATPPGEGAIGIVRLSGPEAGPIAGRIFRGHRGRALDHSRPYCLTLGFLVDPLTGEKIDEVLAVRMPGPRSYTGEDLVEIHAHGGRGLLERALRAAMDAGARAAAPGEFTKRAFLNGRLDLAQAEAVIDLIRSRSDAARRAAVRQLHGRLSRPVHRLREGLADLSARLEAEIEFEEEVELGREPGPSDLDEPIETLREILSRAEAGRGRFDDVQITLCGRTNAGKSSLLNNLLDMDRSIVTPHPGTTRDIVEGLLPLAGAAAVLVDTAGFGEARDPAEEEGMRRSREKLLSADLAIVVIDGSRPLKGTDRMLLDMTAPKESLVAVNKSDLPACVGLEEISALAPGKRLVSTSAITGEGIGQLRGGIEEAVRSRLAARGGEESVVAGARHAEAFSEALGALERGRLNLQHRNPLEMVAADVKEAFAALGKITGETLTEDLLDRVFSRFCIGK